MRIPQGIDAGKVTVYLVALGLDSSMHPQVVRRVARKRQADSVEVKDGHLIVQFNLGHLSGKKAVATLEKLEREVIAIATSFVKTKTSASI